MWLLLLLWGAFLFCAVGTFFNFYGFIIPAAIIPVFIYIYTGAYIMDARSEIKSFTAKFFLWLFAPLIMPYILITFDRQEQEQQGVVQTENTGKLPDFVSNRNTYKREQIQEEKGIGWGKILIFAVIAIAVLVYKFGEWSDSKLKDIRYSITAYGGNKEVIGFAGIAFNSVQPRHDHWMNCETTLTHETLYYFKPKKHFSVFYNYYYLLNEKNKVYEIWAINKKSSIDEFYKVHSELKYLYEEGSIDENDESSLRHKKFFLNGAIITLRLTHGNELYLIFEKH